MFPYPESTLQIIDLNLPQTEIQLKNANPHYPDFDLALTKRLFRLLFLMYLGGFPVDHLTAFLPAMARSGGGVLGGGFGLASAGQFLWSEDYAQESHPSKFVSWQSFRSGRGSPFFDPLSGLWPLAHSLGHVFGLADVVPTTTKEYGVLWNWDFVQLTGSDAGELMSSSIDQANSNTSHWISPASYNKIFQTPNFGQTALARPSSSSSEGPISAASYPRAAAVEYAMVSGTVQRDGSGAQIDPVTHVTATAPQKASDPAGNHCLKFSNATSTLGTYCFTVDVTPTNDPNITEQVFAVAAPFPAGATQMSLLRGTKTVASLSAGKDPVVTILSPKSGDQWQGTNTVSWSVSGAASDATSTVLYSSDGGSTWLPMDTDETGTSYTFDTAQIAGGSQVYFRVITASGMNSGSATVGPLQVVQVPKIGASVGTLDFGNVQPSQMVWGTLGITNSGTGPLTVTGITSDNPAFTVEPLTFPLQVKAGYAAAAQIRLTAPASGTVPGKLSIKSNDPATPTLVVPMTANSSNIPAPSIAVAGGVEFGTIAAGTSATAQLALANSGTVSLTVSSIKSSSAQFTMVSPSLPVTIPAQSEQTFTLQFKPAAAGDYTATLTILSNDPTHASVTAAVHGAASAAGAPAIVPQITAGGIGSLSTFVAPIVRGSLAVLVGSNLASSTSSVFSPPLPTTYQGTSVTVNGIAAPLVFVSPTQINFQVPFEAPATGSALVVATYNGQAGAPLSVAMANYAVGVFQVATGGGLLPAVTHLDGSVVTSGSPAKASEFVNIYLTGVGPLSNPPATGAAARASPLTTCTTTPTITVGGAAAQTTFCGLTPGFAGLVQVNAQLPAALPAGSSLPLVITFSGSASQPVSLAVASAAAGVPAIDFSTTRLDFGTVAVGQSKDLPLTPLAGLFQVSRSGEDMHAGGDCGCAPGQ